MASAMARSGGSDVLQGSWEREQRGTWRSMCRIGQRSRAWSFPARLWIAQFYKKWRTSAVLVAVPRRMIFFRRLPATLNEVRVNTSVLFGTDPRATLTGAFIVSIFYGNVWLGITVPVSMLLLPAVFIAYLDVDTLKRIPAGFWLLLGMTLPVVLQFAAGHPMNGKSDAVVYLPIAYAMATMAALQSASLSETLLWRALIVGGILTTAVMVGMMLFAPSGRFLVPGQDFYTTQVSYERAREEKARQLPEVSGGKKGTLPRTVDFEGKTSSFEAGYYGIKGSIRNALGHSNYISVYFVFLFTVGLFYGSRLYAGVFASATLVTLSRFGVVFLGVALLLWMLHRRGARSTVLTAGMLVFGLLMMAGIIIATGLFDSFLPTSVLARNLYWRSGLEVIARHPWIGAPRSLILDQFNFNIIWNPHNLLLGVGSFSGLIGLTFYLSFLFVSLSSIHRRIAGSRLWAGVFFGFIVLLTWSLFEPIALTPTFEILLAALYMVSRRAEPVGAAHAHRSDPVLAGA